MDSKKIKRCMMPVVAVIGVALLMSGCSLFHKSDSDQKISMDQLPAAVKAAAEKETAGTEIIEVERELKDGTVIYAVTYNENGTEMEVEYSENCTLLFKGPE